MNRQFDKAGVSLHDLSMEKRMSALEAIIPTLATKSDLAELRGDIFRWMIGTVVGLFLGFAGLFFAINRQSPPATAPSPTIIYAIPPPATPTAPVTPSP